MLWRKLQLNWRYAFGEFSIILLGVLAALAVDNWNSDRKDRVLEREYLLSLLGDLRLDNESIDYAMQSTEIYAQSGLAVLKSIKEESIDLPPAEFAKAVSRSGFLVFPTHSRRTISDLMSTGNLRIIESEDVRTGIADYYATIDDVTQFHHNWREYQIHLGKILPEVISFEARQVASHFDQDMVAPWVQQGDIVSIGEATTILERVSMHPNAGPAIENMVRVQTINYRYTSNAKKYLRELVETLEAYLRQLERR